LWRIKVINERGALCQSD